MTDILMVTLCKTKEHLKKVFLDSVKTCGIDLIYEVCQTPLARSCIRIQITFASQQNRKRSLEYFEMMSNKTKSNEGINNYGGDSTLD